MQKTSSQSQPAHVGDWVETRSITGQAPRRGQIVELLGESGHWRYLVHWDESHDSILYPTDGVRIIPEHRVGEPSA